MLGQCFPKVYSNEKYQKNFLCPERPLPTEIKTKQNKIAIDMARNIHQYCQQQDKNSNPISMGICIFLFAVRQHFCFVYKISSITRNFERTYR